jgi:hypothetical protein
MTEVRYEALAGTDAMLGLQFDRAVLVTVEQTGDLHAMRLHVRVPVGSVPDPATDEPFPAVAVPVEPSALSAEQVARAEERARRAMGAANCPCRRPVPHSC